MDDASLPAGEDRTVPAGQPEEPVDFHTLAETLPHLFWSTGADGMPDYWNARLLNFLGRTVEQMQGWGWAETLHPDDRQGSIDVWTEAVAKGSELRIEYRMRRGADGHYCWMEARAAPLRDAAGNVVRWFGTCTDISTRKELEENYRRFATFTSEFVHCCARTGTEPFRFRWVYGAFVPLSGYGTEEILGLGCFLPLVHPDDRQAVADWLLELKPGDRETMEFRIVTKGHGVRWVSQQSRCEAGTMPGELVLYGAVTDITERKAAETALNVSTLALANERDILKAVMNGAKKSHLVFLDTEFNFVHVNETYAATCGYRPEEMIGRNHFVLYPHAENEAIFARVRDTGETVEFHDKPFEFPDQPERGVTYWDWTLTPAKDASGAVLGLVFSLFETTGRKRMEASLQESEERFRAFMDNAPAIAWVKDEQFRYVYINKNLEDRFGDRYTVCAGKTDFDLWPREIAEKFREHDLAVLSSGQSTQFEETALDADGKTCLWLNSKFLFRDAAGRRYIGGIGTDISERIRAENLLRSNDERFRSIMALSPDVISIVTDDGMLIYCSPGVRNVLGYSPEEIQGTKVLDLIHADDWPRIETFIATMHDDPSQIRSIRYRCYKKDGTCCWLESVSSSQFDNPYIRGLISASRDITERKNVEEALQQSEQRYRAIVESQTEYVSRFLPGGVLTYVNQALANWYGVKPEDLVGQSFYPFLREQDREEVIRKIEALTCNGPAVTLELPIPARNGELRWQQWTDHAICDAQDRIVEYQGVGRDITEKKEAELFLAHAKEALEQQVAERTASLTLANARLNREVEERRRIEQDLRAYQRQLEAMSLEVSLAADRERARIAGELHDEVGQRLMLSRIKLDALATVCVEPEYAQALEALQKLVDQTINDIRSLTFQLRPPILASAGLVAAVQWLAEELTQNFGLATEIRHDARPVDFPYETKAAIFQVVRELLLNVAKHADTDRASVSFEVTANALDIVVEDYGVGFEVENVLGKPGRPAGFGLFNIRQRIGHLGGRLDFDSIPGKGSRATIVVPLPAGRLGGER